MTNEKKNKQDNGDRTNQEADSNQRYAKIY